MKKFDFNDYTVANVNTVFKLKDHENSHITFMVKLVLRNGELALVDLGGYLFNIDDAPYISSIHDLVEDNMCSACIYKKTKATHNINDRLLCDRHYNNEVKLTKMSIRDFLFKVESKEDFDILNENYAPFVYNEQDLIYPCLIVMHRELSEMDYGDCYQAYIINKTMKEVK